MRKIYGTVWVYVQFIWKVVRKPERLTLSSLHTIDLNNHHPLIQQFPTLFSGCQDIVTHMQVERQKLCIVPGALSKHSLLSPHTFPLLKKEYANVKIMLVLLLLYIMKK